MKTFVFLLVTLQVLSPTLNAPLRDSAEDAELEDAEDAALEPPHDGVHNHEDPGREGKWTFSFNPGPISISDHSFAGEYEKLSVGHYANVKNIEGNQITENEENVENVETIGGDKITETNENVENVNNVENVATASGLSAAGTSSSAAATITTTAASTTTTTTTAASTTTTTTTAASTTTTTTTTAAASTTTTTTTAASTTTTTTTAASTATTTTAAATATTTTAAATATTTASSSSFDYCTISNEHTMCKYTGPSASCKANTVKRELSDTDKQVIVDKHNELRRKVAKGLEARGKPGPQPAASDMLLMVWDDELATVAQRWADQCTFGHDDKRDIKDGYVGQNAAISSSSKEMTDAALAASYVDATTSWYEEVNDPGFSKDSVNPFVYSSGIGHYTQVVWASSRAVGCGSVYYNSGTGSLPYNQLVICNYFKGGNLQGGAMYGLGKACEACPAGYPTCSDALCTV